MAPHFLFSDNFTNIINANVSDVRRMYVKPELYSSAGGGACHDALEMYVYLLCMYSMYILYEYDNE